LDHEGQLALYALMMSERRGEVRQPGLLYYLKTGQTLGIEMRQDLLSILLQQRNRLASHLERQGEMELPKMTSSAFECGRCNYQESCLLYHRASEEGSLESTPEWLRADYAEKVQHLTRQHLDFFQRWDEMIDVEAQEGIRGNPELWGMTAKERARTGRCLAGLVCTAVSKSGENGKLAYAFARPDTAADTAEAEEHVDNVEGGEAGRDSSRQSEGLRGASLSPGDMIVCSTEDGQYAVATGFVDSVTRVRIVVILDEPLRVRLRGAAGKPADVREERDEQGLPTITGELASVVWRIDRNEMESGLATCKRSLLKLFVGEELTPESSVLHQGMRASATATQAGRQRGHTRLRELVVDLLPPDFNVSRGELDTATLSSQLGARVNEDQASAVRKVLTARDYALILGMPGTGKTTTISHVVQKIIAEGKSVLITAYTNSAVDNLLLKLKGLDVKVLRLGRIDSVHPELQGDTPTAKLQGQSVTADSLRAVVAEHRVVGTTCLGVSHALIQGRIFDYCIVDEASQVCLCVCVCARDDPNPPITDQQRCRLSQVTQPACLAPLFQARTFVLVGDHYQLPPLVRNLEAKGKGMDVSLFRRLSEAHPSAVVHLASQYRMNTDIMLLSNTLVYNHRLKCGSPEVATRSLQLTPEGWEKVRARLQGSMPQSDAAWLMSLMHPDRKVIFIDTDPLGQVARESPGSTGTSNLGEARIIAQIVGAFRTGGLGAECFGVISPYRAQLKVLAEALKEAAPGVEILTVDKYQGRDKECVVLSMVRSNEALRQGKLLKDWQRANVAFTRAKAKLVVVGSASTLASRAPYSDFVELVRRKGWLERCPAGFLG